MAPEFYHYSPKSRRGCLQTILIMVLVLLSIIGYSVYADRHGSKVFEIPEAGINIKVVRKYPRIRVYVSKEHKFENDYIEYTFSNLYPPYIFFHGGDTIYTVDINNEYKMESSSNKFKIININFKYTDTDIRKHDKENQSVCVLRNSFKLIKDSSFVKESKYDLDIYDNAKCIIITDSSEQRIFHYGSIKTLFY